VFVFESGTGLVPSLNSNVGSYGKAQKDVLYKNKKTSALNAEIWFYTGRIACCNIHYCTSFIYSDAITEPRT
jgi:hypothetical protein